MYSAAGGSWGSEHVGDERVRDQRKSSEGTSRHVTAAPHPSHFDEQDAARRWCKRTWVPKMDACSKTISINAHAKLGDIICEAAVVLVVRSAVFPASLRLCSPCEASRSHKVNLVHSVHSPHPFSLLLVHPRPCLLSTQGSTPIFT